jgi:3-methyladenine DNA glycosylase/8-oxoguanine DNA glycosylase
MRKLSPFKPYRGLAAFYLLAYERLSKQPAK